MPADAFLLWHAISLVSLFEAFLSTLLNLQMYSVVAIVLATLLAYSYAQLADSSELLLRSAVKPPLPVSWVKALESSLIKGGGASFVSLLLRA